MTGPALALLVAIMLPGWAFATDQEEQIDHVFHVHCRDGVADPEASCDADGKVDGYCSFGTAAKAFRVRVGGTDSMVRHGVKAVCHCAPGRLGR